MAPLRDEAQKRLTMTARTESGTTGSQRAPVSDVPHALIGSVDAPRSDVLNPFQGHAEALTRCHHGGSEQVVAAQLRQ
jgi:hypothetical protein